MSKKNATSEKSRSKTAARYGGGKKFTAQHPMMTFKRILTYFRPFKVKLIFAAICLLLNVGCTVSGTFMLSVVVDSYILPLAQGDPSVTISQFAAMVGIMAMLYGIGVIMQYTYNWIIVNMTTKIQKNVRDEMFTKMERLPIRFFDTHANGDIMSCYTNDADTLRELLANGIPYLISNGLTVLGIFIAMMVISPLLTLFIIVMLIIMFIIVKYIGGKSGKHFASSRCSATRTPKKPPSTKSTANSVLPLARRTPTQTC